MPVINELIRSEKDVEIVVLTTAYGLLFFYFFLITMAADAITAAVDVAAVETITVSGLSAFFSYVEAAVTAAMH